MERDIKMKTYTNLTIGTLPREIDEHKGREEKEGGWAKYYQIGAYRTHKDNFPPVGDFEHRRYGICQFSLLLLGWRTS